MPGVANYIPNEKLLNEPLKNNLLNEYTNKQLQRIAVPAADTEIYQYREIKNVPRLISPQLKDFWKLLWHVDVKKDHGKPTSDYDSSIGIINKYVIPVDKFESDLPFLKSFGVPSKTAIPSTGKNPEIDKNKLFNSLLTNLRKGNIPVEGDAYTYLNSLPLTEEGTVDISLSIKGNRYKFKVFENPVVDDNGVLIDEAFESKLESMHSFLGNYDILKYSDTSHRGSFIIGGWDPVKMGSSKLYHVHNCEIENDPAGKTTLSSLSKLKASNNDLTEKLRKGFQSNFYSEVIRNPINYPTYTDSGKDPLSYFYCKRRIEILHKGKDGENGNININFKIYFDNNKSELITDSMKIAGGLRAVYSKIKKILGFENKKDIQKIIISKHFGDVGQVLSMFRDTALYNVRNHEDKIFTKNFKKAFESYDLNAITKAFTVGVDYIFYHTSPPQGSSERKLIIFKNISLESPEENYESRRRSSIGRINDILQQIELYKDYIEKKNNERDSLIKFIRDYFNNFQHAETNDSNDLINNKYSEILKKAAQFSVLMNYVTLNKLPNITINTKELQNTKEILEKYPVDRIPEDMDVSNKRLSKYMQRIEEIANDIPTINTINKTIYKKGNKNELKEITLETEIEFKVSANGKTSKSIVNILKGIRIDMNNTSVDEDTMKNKHFYTTRAGIRLNEYYGMSLIVSICKSFQAFDPEFVKLFIDCLYKACATNQKRFIYVITYLEYDKYLPEKEHKFVKGLMEQIQSFMRGMIKHIYSGGSEDDAEDDGRICTIKDSGEFIKLLNEIAFESNLYLKFLYMVHSTEKDEKIAKYLGNYIKRKVGISNKISIIKQKEKEEEKEDETKRSIEEEVTLITNDSFDIYRPIKRFTNYVDIIDISNYIDYFTEDIPFVKEIRTPPKRKAHTTRKRIPFHKASSFFYKGEAPPKPKKKVRTTRKQKRRLSTTEIRMNEERSKSRRIVVEDF